MLFSCVWYLILHSFRTERYFGKDRQRIRETRMVVTELNQTDWLVSIIPNMTEVGAMPVGATMKTAT